MVEEFTKDYWASVHERAIAKLPIAARPDDFPDEHRLFQRYLGTRGGTLYEIGCAPGRWLAYFAREFGMQVAGMEYVEDAVALTRLNMEKQGIAAQVEHGDFFASTLPEGVYDLIYSRGFIEHFENTQAVVDRLVRVARRPGGYVITTVPNFLGFNGWLRKRYVPESYAGHVKLSPRQVRELHEHAGVETLFCDYCGAPRISFPSEVKPELARQGTFRGWLAGWFRYLVAGSMRRFFRMVPWVPRSRLFSPTIIYIGRHGGSI